MANGPAGLPPLALHQMTALEASPIEFVSIARAAGAVAVCLFLNRRDSVGAHFPLVTDDDVPALRACLRDEGMAVGNIDYFPLSAGVDPEAYRPALERGVAIGGTRAVALIDDPDRARAVDRFGQFCALAHGVGLGVGLEFMRLTPPCASLADAAFYVRSVGDVGDVGIGVDILHLARSGGTPADVAAMDPALISHAQVCDGPATMPETEFIREATSERMIPGTGDLPLVAFLQALPADIPIDVEAPVTSLQRAGVPALERARRAMAGTLDAMIAAGMAAG